MKRAKITVVGAGNVGGTVAQRLAEKDRYDVALVDVVDGVPQGKALDLMQAGPVCGYDTRVVGSTGYEETAGSAVVVITSGVPRKPGMSRAQLLETNAGIIRSVVQDVAKRSPQAVLIIVTNPLDAMTYVAHKVSRFPKQRIIGMAGVLDSARLRAFLATELNVSVRDVEAMVLGGHGDSMVPLLKYTTVKGRPIAELLPKERLEALIKRTRDGGAEIVSLLKTGSAFYAPSASVVDMIEAILEDQKRVLPCAALCEGEYGIRGVFVGVPVRLGAGGAEAIIEYDLTPDERDALTASVADVRELCSAVDRFLKDSC
jgi:malate dehydrogenase